MYENITAETLKEKMLNSISNDISKIEGSFTYDIISAICNELEQVYMEMDGSIKKISLENLNGDELEQRIKEKSGLTRKQARKAEGFLKVNGVGTIKKGTVFKTASGIEFIATEDKNIDANNSFISIEAVEAGNSGNLPANQIVNIPVIISGIISVTNASPTTGGLDTEGDEELLQRYYERMRTPATSGNKYHYINWAKEILGVGAARVFLTTTDGNNIVQLVILNNEKKPASDNLVGEVQMYIDPGSKGIGEGQAPIGAKCVVISATEKKITVAVSIKKNDNYSVDSIKGSIESKIIDYLKSIAFSNDSTVSYAKIGALIMESEGVLDYSNLRINDGTANIPVEQAEVAVLEGVLIG